MSRDRRRESEHPRRHFGPLDTLRVGDMYLVSEIRTLDSQLAP